MLCLSNINLLPSTEKQKRPGHVLVRPANTTQAAIASTTSYVHFANQDHNLNFIGGCLRTLHFTCPTGAFPCVLLIAFLCGL